MNSAGSITLGDIFYIWLNDAFYINDKIYMFASNMNRFIEYNLINGEISDLGRMPGEDWFKEELTCKIVAWKESIIIVPLQAKEIGIYSLLEHTWDFLSLKNFCIDTENGINLREAVLVDDCLFMFGGRYPAIVQLDLVTKQVSYIEEPFRNYLSPNGMLKDVFTRNGYVKKQDCLYFATALTNAVFCFNVKDKNYRWIEVGSKENRYSGIVWDGSYFWLSPRLQTSIVRWDGENEVVEYEIPPEQQKANITYYGIWKIKDYLVLPAVEGRGADTIVIEKNGRMMFRKDSYVFFKALDMYGYIFQDADGNIEYSIKEGVINQIRSHVMTKSIVGHLIENAGSECKRAFENAIAGENDVVGLNEFLKLIINENQRGEKVDRG